MSSTYAACTSYNAPSKRCATHFVHILGQWFDLAQWVSTSSPLPLHCLLPPHLSLAISLHPTLPLLPNFSLSTDPYLFPPDFQHRFQSSFLIFPYICQPPCPPLSQPSIPTHISSLTYILPPFSSSHISSSLSFFIPLCPFSPLPPSALTRSHTMNGSGRDSGHSLLPRSNRTIVRCMWKTYFSPCFSLSSHPSPRAGDGGRKLTGRQQQDDDQIYKQPWRPVLV